jgi:hypothetical protein
MRPSWITVTAEPAVEGEGGALFVTPRAPLADWLCWWYSNQESARNGRWNHIAWSRLAIWNWSSRYETPCGSIAVSRMVRSDA